MTTWWVPLLLCHPKRGFTGSFPLPALQVFFLIAKELVIRSQKALTSGVIAQRMYKNREDKMKAFNSAAVRTNSRTRHKQGKEAVYPIQDQHNSNLFKDSS